MSKIQPIATRVENVFTANVKNTKPISIKLAKENGMLKSAIFSEVQSGKEEAYCLYSLGKHSKKENVVYNKVVKEISEICNKAKDGAKLFADIMGWL